MMPLDNDCQFEVQLQTPTPKEAKIASLKS